jgi:hypothetical protein
VHFLQASPTQLQASPTQSQAPPHLSVFIMFFPPGVSALSATLTHPIADVTHPMQIYHFSKILIDRNFLKIYSACLRKKFRDKFFNLEI